MRVIAAAAAFLCFAYSCNAQAGDKYYPPAQEYTTVNAPISADRPSLVRSGYKWLGSPKFTHLPGPWCADAVSAWLIDAGMRPLPGRMAADALKVGKKPTLPQAGDLIIVSTRRGRYGHVGVVVAIKNGEVLIISGNWHSRVMESVVSMRSVTAFVRLS